MQDLEHLFFSHSDLALDDVRKETQGGLVGMDDGELFLEYVQSESLVFDDGTLKNANFDTSSGFGLRGVLGEGSSFAHSSNITKASLKNAINTVQSIRKGYTGDVNMDILAASNVPPLYTDVNPIIGATFSEKSGLLKEIDAYLREQSKYVKQVSVSLAGEWQAVMIVKGDGSVVSDKRPLVRLNVSVVAEKDGVMERGSYGMGGRASYETYITPDRWKAAADEALRQAMVNVEAKPAPAGEMPVVLGPGWPGVLLHEAVGHGLEGDFNRKKTSTFSDLMGKQVASKGVTVVDDGAIPDRRGSLTIDDEGTPTKRNVLIEDGILVGYMQDRMNARLMGVPPTGNGRRESYQHQPMPRMTNTFMLGGDATKEDIIKDIKNGIYAVNFGGGQVDITSGKFVFSASEAYKVENGEIKHPVKGATLIGNGPEIMQRISAIANDLELDHGIGTCGKDGQGVPVGVGQPTILVDRITVGGTEAA